MRGAKKDGEAGKTEEQSSFAVVCLLFCCWLFVFAFCLFSILICIFYLYHFFLIFPLGGVTRVKGRYGGTGNWVDWGTWCDIPKEPIKKLGLKKYEGTQILTRMCNLEKAHGWRPGDKQLATSVSEGRAVFNEEPSPPLTCQITILNLHASGPGANLRVPPDSMDLGQHKWQTFD